jgi:hypothetical protein
LDPTVHSVDFVVLQEEGEEESSGDSTVSSLCCCGAAAVFGILIFIFLFTDKFKKSKKPHSFSTLPPPAYRTPPIYASTPKHPHQFIPVEVNPHHQFKYQFQKN